MATVNDGLFTNNTDVLSIARRLGRAMVEIQKSNSSSVSATSAFDVNRALSYITDLRALVVYVLAAPLLDYPETGPTPIAIPVAPPEMVMENDDLYDLVMQLRIAREEITRSQSTLLSSGLIGFDAVRFNSYLDKAEAFVVKFIQGAKKPLDLPESSPMSPSTGPGLTGGASPRP
jgi:hypothetical protein